MPYHITLVNNLDTRAPAAFHVRYDFRGGAPSQTWALTNVNPDRAVAAFSADCAVDLVNEPNVLTRTLIAHYPTAPNTVNTGISSVMR
jgi:hypothetical protein